MSLVIPRISQQLMPELTPLIVPPLSVMVPLISPLMSRVVPQIFQLRGRDLSTLRKRSIGRLTYSLLSDSIRIVYSLPKQDGNCRTPVGWSIECLNWNTVYRMPKVECASFIYILLVPGAKQTMSLHQHRTIKRSSQHLQASQLNIPSLNMQLSKVLLVLSAGGFANADNYSCKGSSQCGKGLLPRFQKAWNYIQDDYIYRAGGYDSGTCSANGFGYGAGIFVKGNGCTAKGGVLKQFYAEIRNRGCEVCGFVDFGNGCQIKLDYVSGCGSS
ncbi:uncharacterized protein B0I36DRAFT_135694 [Microdochium trichocladiopsis]|uniref:Killer toxin Kp4 domain-containing protein n=1 Tax=Microdochium trichocladiopsis TaxID=1682393 RepID=A0A9P8Y531_9PEZI|nr:uncharacterized protein B0I36DRAFT_135694 [Microdochium trichocladiopsis]KAH7029883.1 hypothetical protein B0I36DRAFT_135694 [Microdochium trichocladiopsis]